MKKWIYTLLCLAPLIAMAVDKPEFTAPVPSDEAVLRMGLDQFEAWGAAHYKSGGETQAYWCDEHYAELRNAENMAAQKRLGDRADQTLTGAARLLRLWAGNRIGARRAYAGGTVYILVSYHEDGVIADLVARCIQSWNKPAPDSATLLDAVQTFAPADSKPEDSGTDLKEYQAALKEEASTLYALKTVIRALPSGPRALMAQHVKDLASSFDTHGR